ncbi:MAG: asparagine synthase (glutamine-hydrolyzing) [Chitinophagales bacterium]|nr:asparagine synthase (glutamine-hydrolyzing) [Chitinophagales bacterium]MDW8428845.1 asparagine synthase (glutamine-hydrolyzing) [Chitinophagales bacterium]
MCGIAGYYGLDGSASRWLPEMARVLAHRGPDAEGFFHTDCAGFAHRRLSIIDLSERANQPMHSADGRWTVMFNGELFNFRDVASELRIKLKTSSDTEVLAESFAREGIDAIHRFNGMFAIAAFDHHTKKLYLIRDRLGVKPLFYCHIPPAWFFASEIKALIHVAPIRRQLELDPIALSFYLRLGYIPAPYTIWKCIRKFPAGHYLELDGSQHRWKCYWEAADQIRNPTSEPQAVLVDQLDALLNSSVQYRMISDVPYGIFFSGGIDSTLIAAIAQKHASAPIKTFTIGFDAATHNEAKYAEHVARYLGTDHHSEYLTEAQARQLFPEVLDLFDEPFADSSALPTYLVARLARRHVKMVLSGDGGDELFLGYGMYRWVKRLHHPLIRALRQPLAAVLPLLGDRYRRAAHLFADTRHLHEHIFSQEQYFFTEHEAAQLLGPLYVDHHLPLPRAAARKLSAVEHQALFDLTYYLRDDLLVKVDRTTMAVGLECRTPFLDYRLATFALNLPESLRMRNGNLKVILRHLLKKYVPPSLTERPKQGFSVPLLSWLRNGLADLVQLYLSPDAIQKGGVLENAYVADLLKRFEQGHFYLHQRLWNLAVLQRWLLKSQKKL